MPSSSAYYDTLQFFGAPSGWKPLMMTRVGDHLHVIRVDATQTCGDPWKCTPKDREFMFVTLSPRLPSGAVPPLGQLNWKQGKLGVGALKAFGGALIPGGGAGRLPRAATYNVTVDTQTLRVHLAEWAGSAAPAARCVIGNGTFIQSVAGAVPVRFMFSERVRLRANVSAWASITRSLPHSRGRLVPTMTKMDLREGGVCSKQSSSPLCPPGWHIFDSQLTLRSPGLNWVSANVFADSLAASTTTGKPADAASADAMLDQPTVWARRTGQWDGLATVRDVSARFNGSRTVRPPDEGWHVVPIHMNLLPATGEVLMTGFLRKSGLPCENAAGAGGRRAAGISFVADPTVIPPEGGTLRIVQSSPGSSEAIGVDEDEENPMRPELGPGLSGDDLSGDVLYCSGHTTLQDGRVFYVGGARYKFLSQPWEHEYGLDYVRLFDPATRKFTRYTDFRMPLGTAWYPTAGRLADGRVLITGGYSDYATESCVKLDCLNPQINLFDPSRMDAGLDPWSVVVNRTFSEAEINPGIREYTRIFVLPKPIFAGGLLREVLLMGKAGTVWLLSLDEGTPMANRLYKPPGAARPDTKCGPDGSDQSTAFPLLDGAHGAFAVYGGCWDSTLRTLDVYDVGSDRWTSYDTGVPRQVPASTFLADGTVILLSGDNPMVDQTTSFAASSDTAGSTDPRVPLIFDPDAGTVVPEATGEEVFRGYHNSVALLPDGSLLLGGGFDQKGDVGCENPNLRRYRPSYLFGGARPRFGSQTPRTVEISASASEEVDIIVAFENGPLHRTKGVALLAVSAFTHSYDHNQRYVRLSLPDGVGSRVGGCSRNCTKCTHGVHPKTGIREDTCVAGHVRARVPAVPAILPGHYHLFLLSDKGVPSAARHAVVRGP